MFDLPITQLAKYYVNVAVFMFLALSVSFEGSYAISGALIISSYLFLFSAQVRAKIALSKVEKGLLVVLSAYLISVLLEVFYYGVSFSKIDAEGKILAFLPLIFLLNGLKLYRFTVILGVATGALGLFILAVYERHYLGDYRVGGSVNPIQLGNIATAFALLSLCFVPVFCALSDKSKYWSIGLVIAAIAALMTSYYTVTRGGVIFLPLLLLIAAAYYFETLKPHGLKILGAIAVLVMAFVVVFPNALDFNRFKGGFDNAISYFSEDNASSSAGIRLELWKAATLIASESPIIGVGAIEYLKEKEKLIERGVINKSTLRFDHSHNAYFYALVRRGGLGLFIIFALLAYPVYAGHKEFKRNDPNTKGMAVSLVIFGLFFLCANLTQVLFAHNSGMIMFTGMLIILVAFLQSLRAEGIEAT